jgi:hypothetical protein
MVIAFDPRNRFGVTVVTSEAVIGGGAIEFIAQYGSAAGGAGAGPRRGDSVQVRKAHGRRASCIRVVNTCAGTGLQSPPDARLH